MLLTAGERISMALLAMAINSLGYTRSRSRALRPACSPRPSTARRASSTSRPDGSRNRWPTGTWQSSRGSRASRKRPWTSPHWAGAGRTPRRWRWLPRCRRCVRDLHRRRRRIHRRPAHRAQRAATGPDHLRRDARIGRVRGKDPAPAVSRVRTHATACRCTSARRSLPSRARSWPDRSRSIPWSKRSSAASPTTAARRRSRSSASRTSRVRRPHCSASWPRPRPTST